MASGETLTVLDTHDFQGKTAKTVKQVLAAQAGVSRFRQRLFQEDGSCEIKDDEVFDAAVKVSLVRLDYFPSDPEQTQQMVAACRDNDLLVLEALLQQPCDPNVADKEGWTPLHYAVDGGHVEASQLLLEAGADKDAQDADGMTPLYSAAADNHFDIVALLLEAGAKKDQPNHGDATSLYIAAENGHLESVRLLVESRAAIDHPLGQGETPLMAAASEGYLEIVQLLVAFGARCDITKNNGFTAMDCATHMSNVEIVRFLAKPTVEHLAEVERDGKVKCLGSGSGAASWAKSCQLRLSCLRPLCFVFPCFSFVPFWLDTVRNKKDSLVPHLVVGTSTKSPRPYQDL